jgi:uncharacterized protein (TIGR00369 family)
LTDDPLSHLQRLTAINASGAFNMLSSIEVAAADEGTVELRMNWNEKLTQYAGHLHAGLIAALLDTACWFAAVTVSDRVTASHFSMNCLKPAVGRLFIAKGFTVRACTTEASTIWSPRGASGQWCPANESTP